MSQNAFILVVVMSLCFVVFALILLRINPNDYETVFNKTAEDKKLEIIASSLLAGAEVRTDCTELKCICDLVDDLEFLHPGIGNNLEFYRREPSDFNYYLRNSNQD